MKAAKEGGRFRMKKWFPWQMALLTAWPYAALAANLFLIRIGLAAWGCW